MEQIEVKSLIDQNMRLNFLVGVMYANLMNQKQEWHDWILKAVESVCYNNGSMPEFPE